MIIIQTVVLDRNRELPWVYVVTCSEILYDCPLVDLMF